MAKQNQNGKGNGNNNENTVSCLVSSFSNYQNFLVSDVDGNVAGTAIRNKNPKGSPIAVILPLKFISAANKILPGIKKELDIEPIMTSKNIIVSIKEFDLPEGRDDVIFVSGKENGEDQFRFYSRQPNPEAIVLEAPEESLFKASGTRITYIPLDNFMFIMSIENGHNKTLIVPQIPEDGLEVSVPNPDDLYLLQAIWPEIQLFTKYRDNKFLLFSPVLNFADIDADLLQVRKNIGDNEMTVLPSGKFLG